MEELRARTLTEMARYRRQCLAIGSRNLRRAAKHTGPYGSLWRGRQEEVGDQLGLHVDLRICVGARRLGPVRLQYGVRTAMVPLHRDADARAGGRVQHRPGDHPRRRLGHAGDGVSDGNAGLLPVRVRGDHGDHPCGLRAGAHELQGVGDLLPGMDDAVLHRGSVQPVGRRMARRPWGGRFLRRLRDPSCRRLFRLRCRGDGRPSPATGPRAFPAQQPAGDADRRRHPVARLERVQRW